MDQFGQIYFAHHGRHDVAVFEMEVVVRAVQVRRHDCDIVRTVLKVIAFAHFQSGDFGDGVFFVGVFQR